MGTEDNKKKGRVSMRQLYITILLLIIFVAAGTAEAARIGGGNISLKGGKEGDVTFGHDSHVAGSGLNCTDCHNKIYTTKEKHKKVTMAQMWKGKSCGTCHNGKKAFDVKSDCGNCHKK